MTRRLIVSCGAADTRAAILLSNEIVGFWFGPARGDEDLARAPQAGDAYMGRVRSVSKPLEAAFVNIGDSRDAFLPLRDGGPVPVEGAALAVVVRRPPLGDKGAVVGRAEVERVGAAAPPFRIGPRLDPAVEAHLWARSQGDLDDCLVEDPASASALRAAGAGAVAISSSALAEADGDAALETSLQRALPLVGGARLVFDETEALTTVDVDAAHAASGKDAGRLNDRVNHAAAGRLFRELARRGAGGRIVVDFLPSSDAAARRRLSDALKGAAAGVFAARFGRLSEDGLFDLNAPRRRFTLLEEATEPADGAGFLRSGRRLTLDWSAKAAVRALEARLASRAQARPTLRAGAAIAAMLTTARPQWLERVAARSGARFALVAAPEFEERRFDVVE